VLCASPRGRRSKDPSSLEKKSRLLKKNVGEAFSAVSYIDQRRSNSALEPDASIGVMTVKSRQR
jgi:hypothetical protein